jgi:hypothetical protein
MESETEVTMKIFYFLAAVAAVAAAGTASAQVPPNTGRPSYDMPRAYDRDAQGNETYQYRSRPGPHRSHKHRRHHYDND